MSGLPSPQQFARPHSMSHEPVALADLPVPIDQHAHALRHLLRVHGGDLGRADRPLGIGRLLVRALRRGVPVWPRRLLRSEVWWTIVAHAGRKGRRDRMHAMRALGLEQTPAIIATTTKPISVLWQPDASIALLARD